jgi:hypothetical protein
MGRIRLIGETSTKEYQFLEAVANELKIRNVPDGVDILKADSTTITDAGGVKLNAHASRHNKGGADAIPDDGLGYSQVKVSFGTASSVSVDAGGAYAVPEGAWLAFLGANTRAEAYDPIAAAWKTVIAAGGNGFLLSDGSSVRLYNAGTAAESSNLVPIV